MLKPHDQDMLEAVAEVLRTGLSDVRRDMDARLADMQTRLNFQPEKGDRGDDGTSVTLEDVQPLIDKAVSDAVSALPPAEPGKDAEVDLGALGALVSTMVASAVAEIPPPEPGKSVSLADVQPMIEQTVKEAVAAIPPPDLTPLTDGVAELRRESVEAHERHGDFLRQDSERIEKLEQRFAALPSPPEPVDVDAVVERVLAKVPPTDVDSIVDVVNERMRSLMDAAVEKIATTAASAARAEIDAIPKPQDGKSITVEDIRGLFEAEQAKWALDFERRAADVLQRAIDRMPKPRDGTDGIGVEDMEFESIDDLTFEIRWLREGKIVKTHQHRFATPHDKGVWKPDVDYRRGAGVSWGGSWFIAQVDHPQGKPEQSKEWRMAVKRGRDGDPGKQGDPGKNGRDLTKPNGAGR